MPNTKTHDIITAGLFPVIGGIFYFIIGVELLSILILLGGFLFSSLMFNGDLDILSKPYNRWGLLRVIWYPYRLIFSHRSIFTHGIIIGSIIRLMWISPLIFVLLYLLGYDIRILFTGDYYLWFLLGIELGNINHTACDYII